MQDIKSVFMNMTENKLQSTTAELKELYDIEQQSQGQDHRERLQVRDLNKVYMHARHQSVLINMMENKLQPTN